MNTVTRIAVLGAAFLFTACAAKIHGTVQLVDPNLKPVPDQPLEGTTVNMINTSAALEQASHSAVTDAKGRFASAKDALTPGTYKVEASRIGYATETATVEIKGSTRKKLKIQLKQIMEGRRRSIGGGGSDEDKIINPGEVNIQPPMM
ncbi:MAG TPA: carboxypeptidase-like regulatory domain-containing protein [Acidiferrobacterales bacterium]|jgi:hypothetical protein